MINGGRTKAWMSDFKIPAVANHEFVDEFRNECTLLREMLIKHFPEHVINDQSNDDFLRWKICSIVLQTEENRVLVAMESCLKRAGFHIDVLVYDGLMIRLGGAPVDEHVLRATERNVLQETGYKIQLEVKPMNKPFPF